MVNCCTFCNRLLLETKPVNGAISNIASGKDIDALFICINNACNMRYATYLSKGSIVKETIEAGDYNISYYKDNAVIVLKNGVGINSKFRAQFDGNYSPKDYPKLVERADKLMTFQ